MPWRQAEREDPQHGGVTPYLSLARARTPLHSAEDTLSRQSVKTSLSAVRRDARVLVAELRLYLARSDRTAIDRVLPPDSSGRRIRVVTQRVGLSEEAGVQQRLARSQDVVGIAGQRVVAEDGSQT